MKFKFLKEMSRLKKKLMLYFILISIVSISVSAEIILEVSSAKLAYSIRSNLNEHIENSISDKEASAIIKDFDYDTVFKPIYNLRNRMILFLLVVTASIISSFFLFTKDIVSPMEGLVDATKKIAGGDLTVRVPILTKDEIGQVGSLINDINMNLLQLVIQVKTELDQHKKNMHVLSAKIDEITNQDKTGRVISEKKMSLSEFKNRIRMVREVSGLFKKMSAEFTALQTYVNMYKTYNSSESEYSREEILEALKDYTEDIWVE